MYCKSGNSIPPRATDSSPSHLVNDAPVAETENDGPTVNCSMAPFLEAGKTSQAPKRTRAHRRCQIQDNSSLKSTDHKAATEDETLTKVSGSSTSAKTEGSVANELGTGFNAPNLNPARGSLYHLTDDIEGNTSETQFGSEQAGTHTLISQDLSGSAECLLIHHESFGVELSPRRCTMSRLSDPGSRDSDKRGGKDNATWRRPQWGQNRRCARWSTQIGQKLMDMETTMEPFLLEGSQLLQGNYLRKESQSGRVNEASSKEHSPAIRERRLGSNEQNPHMLNVGHIHHGAEYHMKVVTRGSSTNRVNNHGYPAQNFIRLEPSPRIPANSNGNIDSVDEILLQHRKSDGGSLSFNCKPLQAQVLLPTQKQFGSKLNSNENTKNEYKSQAGQRDEGKCLALVGVKVGGLPARS